MGAAGVEHLHLPSTSGTGTCFVLHTNGMLGWGEVGKHEGEPGGDGSAGGGDSRRFHCSCPVWSMA